MKKKYGFAVLFPFILCALLLPGCKELFHPNSGNEDNDNNGNTGQNDSSTRLNAPTGLNASINAGYLTISWNAVSGAEWYEGFVSDNPYSNYEPFLDQQQVYGTSFSVYIGMDMYYDTYIKIRACKNGVQSPLSEYYHLSYTSPPLGAFMVNAMALSSESVSLTWNYIDGADYYTVLRSQSRSGSYSTLHSDLTDLFFMDDGLNPGATYYYKVEAYSSRHAKIAESEPVQATTQQASPEIPLPYEQWISNTLTEGTAHYYTFYAIAGTTYYISWDDNYDGSGKYNCDIRVSASIDGAVLFSGADSGYTDPIPVTVANSGNISITVEGYGYDWAGTYAIKYSY
ncbi:MAG: fibronectin type III domain-containing protein [Treponema sp.]|jgi:hypothetical protein|nr:fibronectin type III domain-containing protein [Treponema sp.]